MSSKFVQKMFDEVKLGANFISEIEQVFHEVSGGEVPIKSLSDMGAYTLNEVLKFFYEMILKKVGYHGLSLEELYDLIKELFDIYEKVKKGLEKR